MANDLTTQLNPALLSQGKSLPAIDLKRIDETAKEFEAVFIAEMLKPMFESVPVNATFGGGKGEDIFRGFLRDEYGKLLAQRGGIGITELVKQQLIEMQSASIKPELAQNMHGDGKRVTGGNGNVL